MRFVDLLNNDSQTLILFFAGWGYDEACVSHLKTAKYDVKLAYDYRIISPLSSSFFEGYSNVVVVAWSFGVGVANMVLSDVQNSINRAYAINGTLFPIDDLNGIPVDVFNGTLATLNNRSYQRFQARVMGGASNYIKNSIYLPKRIFEEQKDELEALSSHFKSLFNSNLIWQKAICGTEDLIFPTQNLIRFWGNKAIEKPLPHFIFDNYQTWDELLNDFTNE